MSLRRTASSWLRLGRVLGLLLVGAGVIVPTRANAAELTKVVDIRRLSPEEADRGLPVRLRATVIWISVSDRRSIFIQDETGGTYFRPGELSLPALGDEVEVIGNTVFGIYVPGIVANSYRVLRHGVLPPGKAATYEDLTSGRFHYQRVAVEGVVRSFKRLDDARRLMRLDLGPRILDVHVWSHFADEDSLIDSRVRVEGLAVGTVNISNLRQLIRPFLRIQFRSEVTILAPPRRPGDTPRVSGAQLLAFDVADRHGHRVAVGGVVTATVSDGLIFLRDGNAAFGVRSTSPTGVAVGDRLEVLGFPEAERYNVILEDAQVVHREPGAPPVPIETSVKVLLKGSHASDLVKVRGVVVDVVRAEGGQVAVLRAENSRIGLHVPDPAPSLQTGATIAAVGISQIKTSSGTGFHEWPEFLRIDTRSKDDVIVEKAPPWWNAQRLAVLLGAIGVITVIACGWIFLLRRQVRRQTATLRSAIKSEAILQERQRIAREFHDTLAQDLTGLHLRLDAIAAQTLEGNIQALLNGSRSLVTRIQIETKNLVSDLREPLEPVSNLTTSLEELAHQCSCDATAVRAEVCDLPPHFPAPVAHHLRMIAQEAVTNALKHAHAREVVIRLGKRDRAICLTVCDDGRGFDVLAHTYGNHGHFGCMGIRERCEKLGGQITWNSIPGKGTTVEVVLELSGASSTENEVGGGLNRDGANEETTERLNYNYG
jgi:signal transduction histidine kinase